MMAFMDAEDTTVKLKRLYFRKHMTKRHLLIEDKVVLIQGTLIYPTIKSRRYPLTALNLPQSAGA